jgi:hypothetical protein
MIFTTGADFAAKHITRRKASGGGRRVSLGDWRVILATEAVGVNGKGYLRVVASGVSKIALFCSA